MPFSSKPEDRENSYIIEIPHSLAVHILDFAKQFGMKIDLTELDKDKYMHKWPNTRECQLCRRLHEELKKQL